MMTAAWLGLPAYIEGGDPAVRCRFPFRRSGRSRFTPCAGGVGAVSHGVRCGCPRTLIGFWTHPVVVCERDPGAAGPDYVKPISVPRASMRDQVTTAPTADLAQNETGRRKRQHRRVTAFDIVGKPGSKRRHHRHAALATGGVKQALLRLMECAARWSSVMATRSRASAQEQALHGLPRVYQSGFSLRGATRARRAQPSVGCFRRRGPAAPRSVSGAVAIGGCNATSCARAPEHGCPGRHCRHG